MGFLRMNSGFLIILKCDFWEVSADEGRDLLDFYDTMVDTMKGWKNGVGNRD